VDFAEDKEVPYGHRPTGTSVMKGSGQVCASWNGWGYKRETGGFYERSSKYQVSDHDAGNIIMSEC